MKFVGTALVLLGVSSLASCKGSSSALPPASIYGADARAQTPFQPDSAFAARARAKNGPIIIVANPGGSWQLCRIQPDGKALKQITHMPATTFSAWFPLVSGTRIAFTYGDGSGSTDVYTVNIDGTHLHRVTHDGLSGSPAFSPDSRRLVYQTFNVKTGRQPYLVTIPVDDPSDKHVVTSDLYVSFYGEYTPDGQSILYDTTDSGTQGTWIMNADGTDKRTLTPPKGVFCPYSVSPDGKRVLLNDYCGDFQTGQKIWVMNLDDQKLAQLTHPPAGSEDSTPTYSPDGKKIAFASNRRDPNNVDLWVMNADGTDTHVIRTGLTVGGCASNCVAPSWAPAQ